MGVNGYQWSPIWPRFGHSNLQVLNAYIAQQYGCLHEREPGRRGLQPALGSTQKAKNSQRVEFFAFSCGVFVITKNPEVRKSGAVGNIGKARVDASSGRRRILPPWPRVPCRRTERSGGFGDLVGHFFLLFSGCHVGRPLASSCQQNGKPRRDRRVVCCVWCVDQLHQNKRNRQSSHV
jgi:hypothetical protein